jgi:hypothetical protein
MPLARSTWPLHRGVGDRGVVDVDSIVLAKVPEDRASESCTQVGDDPIGHTKAMLDISDEFDCFF